MYIYMDTRFTLELLLGTGREGGREGGGRIMK